MTAAPLWTRDEPPRQGLGLMRLQEPGAGAADRDPVKVVHAALDAGVTLLDTAELHGNEELVGRTIAGRRDEVDPVLDVTASCGRFRTLRRLGRPWERSGPVGLSNVTVEDIRCAHAIHPLLAVQEQGRRRGQPWCRGPAPPAWAMCERTRRQRTSGWTSPSWTC